LGELLHFLQRDIFIENETENWQHGVYSGIAKHEISVVDGNGDRVKDQGEDALYDGNDETPVYDELRHHCRVLISQTPVPQNQFGKMLEFENGKVRSQSSLLSLLSHDTHADVRHLDHPHIVTAIANPQHYLPRVILDSLSNDSLLGRGNPAANDRWCFGSNSIEEVWHLMKRNRKG